MQSTKHRLIELINGEQPSVSRHKLIHAFEPHRRAKAAEELEALVKAGYVNLIGTGRRGMPIKIVQSPTWPYNKCPL
jgi:predicted HTH transcriptional regulator